MEVSHFEACPFNLHLTNSGKPLEARQRLRATGGFPRCCRAAAAAAPPRHHRITARIEEYILD